MKNSWILSNILTILIFQLRLWRPPDCINLTFQPSTSRQWQYWISLLSNTKQWLARILPWPEKFKDFSWKLKKLRNFQPLRKWKWSEEYWSRKKKKSIPIWRNPKCTQRTWNPRNYALWKSWRKTVRGIRDVQKEAIKIEKLSPKL